MTDERGFQVALQTLTEEDAVGQLRRRDGLMATLGSEDAALKLDWVEAVARLLADPVRLEEIETEARAIRERGIRHIIWAGMGGSVLTVRVLRELGFCGGQADPSPSEHQQETIALYPLDSTDPAALNAIVRAIASAKHLMLPAHAVVAENDEASHAAWLQALLCDVMMIGVSMGMTSEEPMTHLTWFTSLLERAGLRPAEHVLVMTLLGSYLDAFAREQRVPSRPLQLDGGTGTGGRMSAPGTRVFLLPAALYLTGLSDDSGQLRAVLRMAWEEHDLELATTRPSDHPFVRLAAVLSAASQRDACRLLVRMPDGWGVVVSWLEQLMEESLGKAGKGVVVFDDQPLNTSAPGYRPAGMLRVRVLTGEAPSTMTPRAPHEPDFALLQPSLAATEPRRRLAAVTATFLGWQLSMALYGYLHHIPFAGQPAVENYKARARALRAQPDPLRVASQSQPTLHAGVLTLLAPAEVMAVEQPPTASQLAAAFAEVLRQTSTAPATYQHIHARALSYLDVTINGEAPESLLADLDARVRAIGNARLGVPVKLRRAPAAYHSTEQSQMDGPPDLVSLRLVARKTESSLLGSYTNQFLHAQAVSTWQAMRAVGRLCYLLVIDGALDDARKPLIDFFSHVEAYLRPV